MLRLATATKTASTTTASPVERPAWATVVAAPMVRIRFFGFTALSPTASAKARTGVTRSIAANHFGGDALAPSRGRFFQWRYPMRTSDAPSTIFSTDVLSDALPLLETFAPSEIA